MSFTFIDQICFIFTASFGSIQLLSLVQLFATPWATVRQVSLSITNSWSLLKLMSITSVMPSNALILCQLLLLLTSIFPNIRVFSNESTLPIRWPKYWSFSPSCEYSGLTSFRIDWFDLFAVQGTLKILLQHDSLKASIFQLSLFILRIYFSNLVNSGKFVKIGSCVICTRLLICEGSQTFWHNKLLHNYLALSLESAISLSIPVLL